MNEERIRNLLTEIHENNPYENLGDLLLPEKLDPVYGNASFNSTIAALRPSLIIEVGTWLGNSAIYMADICKSLGLDTKIICVDTWLGGIEHGFSSPFNSSLMRRNGYPQQYYQFLSNVIHRGYQDVIIPFPATSVIAGRYFAIRGITSKLIYVDASHEYEDALADFELYKNVLEPGGVMMGDDYGSWPGVTKAALEFASKNGGNAVATYGKFFWAPESTDPMLLDKFVTLK